MKTALLTLLFLFRDLLNVQPVVSGRYEGLNLAFNPKTNTITGYFEQYGGYDENTKAPQFSCIFYLQGKLSNNVSRIRTYYPSGEKQTVIAGQLRIWKDASVSLQLPEEHGGCWNVQHFADEPVLFGLTEKTDWLEIRHVTAARAYFHTDTLESTRRKAYVVTGNLVYLDRIVGQWAHGRYYGKSVTAGWVRLNQLNELRN